MVSRGPAFTGVGDVLLGDVIEHAGNRDSDGNPVGLIIELEANSVWKSTMTAQLD